jgi:hypothetical protein
MTYTLSSNSCAGYVTALHAPFVLRLALAAVALRLIQIAVNKEQTKDPIASTASAIAQAIRAYSRPASMLLQVRFTTERICKICNIYV